MKSHSRLLAILLLLTVSLAAVVPLILRGSSCGHDFDFHLLSWLETSVDWRQGLVFPHWLASANYGAGEPRFVFYPPLSWFLGAALGSIAGWVAAPILLTWVGLFTAGIAVYELTQRFSSRFAATAVACLFIANPYLLFVAYERTAYAELLSTALIAWLLLFALSERVPVARISLVVAALWLTNAPAGVMACYTLAAVALFRVGTERRWDAGWRAALGCSLGIGMAGFYLLPAAYEQRWVQIERAIHEGMRVEDSFLFAHTGLVYHDAVLHRASMIATIVLGIGLAAAFSAWRVAPRPSAQHRVLALFTLLLAGILFLQLRVSAGLWRLLPRLLFLQFPWRWMLVATVAAAVTLALALDRPWLRGGLRVVVPVVVFGSLWYCSHAFYLRCDVDDSVAGQLAIWHDGSGVAGTDEYTARDADNSAVLQDIPHVRVLRELDAELPAEGAGDNPEWLSDFYFPTTATATMSVPVWSAEQHRVVIDSREPAFAVLTLMAYPAWRVTLNGAPARLEHRDDGLISVAVPAGRSTIEADWQTTSDFVWGRVLSAVAVLLLAIFVLLEKRVMD